MSDHQTKNDMFIILALLIMVMSFAPAILALPKGIFKG